MQTPAEKLAVMRHSMRCFYFGLLSWLPIAGLWFALFALTGYWKTRRLSRGEWNPAKPYLLFGLLLGLFGGFVSLAIILAIGIRWVNSYGK